MRTAWGRIGLVVLASAVVLGAATAAWGADQSVMMRGIRFEPERVEIEVGDTVTWQNLDGVSHTVTANDGTFDSGTVGPTETYAYTFDTAGEYPYICEFHAPDMKGVVVVSGSPPPTTTTAAPPPEEEPPPETTSPPPTAAPTTSQTAGSDDPETVTTTSAPTTTTVASSTTSPTTSTTLSATPAAADSGDEGGGGGVIALVAALMVLAVAAGGVGWWRLRRT